MNTSTKLIKFGGAILAVLFLSGGLLTLAQNANNSSTEQVLCIPSINENSCLYDKNRKEFLIPPVWTDSKIQDGDGDNIVFFNSPPIPNASLLIFIGALIKHAREQMPGFNFSKTLKNAFAYPFLDTAANMGYRVICLDYKYDPSGNIICAGKNKPCYECFREKKVFGSEKMPEVVVSPAECILNRLTKLLQYLAVHYPEQGWGEYVLQNGEPNWNRIVLTGHSQGSGMAAYLAKRRSVARVILCSSPWDHYVRPTGIAAWLSWHSETPPERWYGMYHAKESQASWLRQTYAALGLTPSHIRVATAEPRRYPGIKGDIYHYALLDGHITAIREDNTYVLQNVWNFLLGQSN